MPAVGQCAGEFFKGWCFDDFAACFADVFDAVVVRGGPLGERVLVVADVLVKDEYGRGPGLLDEGVAGDFVAEIFVVVSLAFEVDQDGVFAEVGFDFEEVVEADSCGGCGEEVAVETVEGSCGLRACFECALKASAGVLRYAADDYVIGFCAEVLRAQFGVGLVSAG